MASATEVVVLFVLHLALAWTLISLGRDGATLLHGGRSPSWTYLAAKVLAYSYLQNQAARSWLRVPGWILGWHLRRQTSHQRQLLLDELDESKAAAAGREVNAALGVDRVRSEVKHASEPKAWRCIIGFFHPFCNAGGGGERVLWAAVRATQNSYPGAMCIVYTGDHQTKLEILKRVRERFNIQLDEPRVFFRHLSTRHYVHASTWPHFTLLGQSLGSLLLVVDAFSLLVPDVFIDTMGYAYTLALAKYCFPSMPTGAYVHYPTISTDMLGSLDMEEGRGLHAGAGKGVKGALKREYWELFAKTYGWAGGHVDIVMTNSSWTQAHIQTLWGHARSKRGRVSEIKVVFPPVAVRELEDAVGARSADRESNLICIAQFRPEKNHKLLVEAFAKTVHSEKAATEPRLKDAKLVLIGSVRDDEDAKRVYELRLLAHELKVKDEVRFLCDASWPEILDWLGKSSVGVNGMWNEHFGIGVVEYQAAGLICVVNDSGGPKADIVVDYDGGPTGFHASTVDDYAEAFDRALTLSPEKSSAMRARAQRSAQRFSEAEFDKGWDDRLQELVEMSKQGLPRPRIFSTMALYLMGICLGFVAVDLKSSLT